MAKFKIGDRVMEKPPNDFGYHGKVGKVVFVKSYPFLVYNVKHTDGRIQEYHKGELKRVK